jgi:hypothetical protein
VLEDHPCREEEVMTRHVGIIQGLGVVGLAACLCVAPHASAQIPASATWLEGLPAVRVDATHDRAIRRELGEIEATRSVLKIRIVDGRYYWASREDRPLTLNTSGDFTYLSSAEPGRYVRFRRLNDRLTYVEHVDMPTGSVTFWGELRVVLGK